MTNDTATYDSNFITKKNTFTKTGYTFNGWNEKADGTGTVWGLTTSGVYESGKTWKWTYTKNITLYAQWKANTNTKYVVKHYKQKLDGTSPALYVVPFPSALVFHEHVYPVFDIAGIATDGFAFQCAYNVPFDVYDVFLNELVIYPFSFIIKWNK
jgi:uncharacterized repeat protein (TIGR02543 family)